MHERCFKTQSRAFALSEVLEGGKIYVLIVLKTQIAVFLHPIVKAMGYSFNHFN